MQYQDLEPSDDEEANDENKEKEARSSSLAHINTKTYIESQKKDELRKRSQKIREEYQSAEMEKMKKYQKLLNIEGDLDSENDCRSVDEDEEIEIKTIKSVDDFPSLLEYDAPVKIFDPKQVEVPQIIEPHIIQKMDAVEMLNVIFPPKCWYTKDGTLMQKKVSAKPVHRNEVKNLHEALNVRLEATEARNNDVCNIRREFFRQCFDEVIRQVTIESPHSGLLLWRLRDEIDMTIHAYKTLFKSSVEFGRDMACESQDDEETNDLEARVRVLEKEKKGLEDNFCAIREKNDQIIIRSTELRESEEKRVIERLNFLKNVTNQLRSQIEGIMNIKT